jgi:DNA-directed RNA polymerase subunit beta
MAYKNVKYGKKAVRRNYSKIRTEVELPDLLEIQTSSFEKFVTEDLKELFKDISPISNESGTLNLYFGEHYFEQPKYDIVQSKLRDINYSRSLKVKVLLKVNYKNEQGENQEELIEKEIFMGDFPFMTPAGTFIINGAERVIISQIIRSSGIYYSKELDKKTGLTRFSGQMIPTRGAWIEFETGSKDIWYAKFDRSKKIPVTTFIRSMGIAKNKDIYDLFGKSTFLEAAMEREAKDIADRKRNYLEKNKSNKDRIKVIEKYTEYDWSLIDMYVKLRQEEDVPPENARDFLISRLFDDRRYDLQTVGRYKYNKKLDVIERAKGLKLAEDIKAVQYDPETGEILGEEIIAKAGEKLTEELCAILRENREAFRKPLPIASDMLEAMENYYESEIYINETVSQPMCEILKVYTKDGGRESKVTILGNDQRETSLHATLSDIFAATSYYFNLYDGIGSLDDIDHLGNRRLRLIGELLKNQFRAGLLKLEKNIKDRMSTNFGRDEVQSVVSELDLTEKTKKLQGLINIKPLTSLLKEFFGSSQLSQFMDQINPLAEITQKRRISALGSGGIARDRAGVEVRDVHYTHYGRMCPIETPEGPSIGLITSLATYARVNELGFIESPYYKFTRDANGRKVVTNEIVYLTANDEDTLVIAAANTTLDEEGHIIDEKVIGRKHGETEFVDPDEVDYMDISPKQIISVATSTIPFLEHDDAVRALMGANMQRQAVPIINPESPIVGTGIEHKAAHDRGSAIVAEASGVVE